MQKFYSAALNRALGFAGEARWRPIFKSLPYVPGFQRKRIAD
jgi:hypothetical protein